MSQQVPQTPETFCWAGAVCLAPRESVLRHWRCSHPTPSPQAHKSKLATYRDSVSMHGQCQITNITDRVDKHVFVDVSTTEVHEPLPDVRMAALHRGNNATVGHRHLALAPLKKHEHDNRAHENSSSSPDRIMMCKHDAHTAMCGSHPQALTSHCTNSKFPLEHAALSADASPCKRTVRTIHTGTSLSP